MYIIEFEKGVYHIEGKGDPARTLVLSNAKSFSDKQIAEHKLSNIVKTIKRFRKFDNPKVRWRDEVSMKLT